MIISCNILFMKKDFLLTILTLSFNLLEDVKRSAVCNSIYYMVKDFFLYEEVQEAIKDDLGIKK